MAVSDPFAALDPLQDGLAAFCRALDPDAHTPADAALGIGRLVRLEKLAAGARLRLARRVDSTVTGGDGSATDKADWLGDTTGQTSKDAAKDLETSEQLAALGATDQAVANGELSPTQARAITSGAGADPAAESKLLNTARNASVSELEGEAKKTRAAATDDAEKNRRAHHNRDLSGGTDPDTGEGWAHAKGPAAVLAQLWAHLEPWIQAEFANARRQGRRQRRGAYAFDALLAALAYAAAARRGHPTPTGDGDGDGDGPVSVPQGPPTSILARVDVAAILRGHTLAGETCDIDGLGPVPVAALRELLPQAAIDLIVTNGVDVFNVTHLGRRANARQQVVLHWLGGRCSRLGCPATRHLQIDHRDPYANIKITEVTNLDWLCPDDHGLKTHHGWALVAGTGRRPMVPPDHPHHPRNTTDPPADPPAEPPGDPPRPAAA
jgi:hypothetical protein